VGATRRRSATSREREYIQHNRNVEDGKAGLKNLIARPPKDTKIESVRLLPDGDYVVAHGEFSLPRPRSHSTFSDSRRASSPSWDNIQDKCLAPNESGGTQLD
jgi:predicted SnoaL-like aldol condensation-catalyzing enzyme